MPYSIFICDALDKNQSGRPHCSRSSVRSSCFRASRSSRLSLNCAIGESGCFASGAGTFLILAAGFTKIRSCILTLAFLRRSRSALVIRNLLSVSMTCNVAFDERISEVSHKAVSIIQKNLQKSPK